MIDETFVIHIHTYTYIYIYIYIYIPRYVYLSPISPRSVSWFTGSFLFHRGRMKQKENTDEKVRSVSIFFVGKL